MCKKRTALEGPRDNEKYEFVEIGKFRVRYAVDIQSSQPLADQMGPLRRPETHLHVSRDLLVGFLPRFLRSDRRFRSILLDLAAANIPRAAPA